LGNKILYTYFSNITSLKTIKVFGGAQATVLSILPVFDRKSTKHCELEKPKVENLNFCFVFKWV